MSIMAKNPIMSLDFLDLAKAQIKCGKEKLAIETLKAITEDLEDFVKECDKE